MRCLVEFCHDRHISCLVGHNYDLVYFQARIPALATVPPTAFGNWHLICHGGPRFPFLHFMYIDVALCKSDVVIGTQTLIEADHDLRCVGHVNVPYCFNDYDTRIRVYLVT